MCYLERDDLELSNLYMWIQCVLVFHWLFVSGDSAYKKQSHH